MHILIVEDNELNQMVLHDLIELEFPDVKFTILNNASDALRQDYTTIDIVLSDLSMYPIDGFTLYTKLRNELDVQIPILAITAMAIDGDREKILLHGFDDYISKPIDSTKLFEVLRKYI